MANAFDPYHKWLGIPPSEQPPNHYRLLGIPIFENDPDVIETATDQRILHLRTLQLGKQSDLSEQLLGKVVAAQICLLNSEKKAEYDECLRREQRVSGAEDPPPTDATEGKEVDKQAATGSVGVVRLTDDDPPVVVHTSPMRRTSRPWIVGGLIAILVCFVLLALDLSSKNDLADESVASAKPPGKNIASSTGAETESPSAEPMATAKPTITLLDEEPKTSPKESDLSAEQPAAMVKEKTAPVPDAQVKAAQEPQAPAANVSAPAIRSPKTELPKQETAPKSKTKQPLPSNTAHKEILEQPNKNYNLSEAKTTGKQAGTSHHKAKIEKRLGGPQERAPMFTRWPFGEAEAKQRQKITSKALGHPVNFTNSIGMKFKLIPAGSFTMGSPEVEKNRDSDEGPVHRVQITKPLYLGLYEVTQEQYERIMGANPSTFKGSTNPVENVSWRDAVEFCKKLSSKEGQTYRLPMEAEWEYACRAGTRTPFSFGSVLNGKQANCDGNFPYGTETKGPYLRKTISVGSYAANAWGLCDMHGNVYECCADWFDRGYYKNSPTDDPKGPTSGSFRVDRGGSWRCYAGSCRSADRYSHSPSYRSSNLGFRIALVTSE